MTKPRLLTALAFGPLILSIMACGYYMRQMGVAEVGTPNSFTVYDETSSIWTWNVVRQQTYELTADRIASRADFVYLGICTIATNECSGKYLLASDRQVGAPAQVTFTPDEETTVYIIIEAGYGVSNDLGEFTLLIRPIDG